MMATVYPPQNAPRAARTGELSLAEGAPDDELPSRPRYWIPEYVYFCITKDGLVFLDARRRKYRALSMDDVRALAPLVEDWRDSVSTAPEPWIPDPERIRQANALLRAGLLTRTRPLTRHQRLATVEQPDKLVGIGPGATAYPRVRLRHVFAFIVALLSGIWMLRCRPFTTVVDTVKSRKKRAHCSLVDPCRNDLVLVFRRIRPFFFSSKGHCLLHAIALLNFLACHGVFATWYIGVRTNPWGAHSWVGNDGAVFDCTPERVLFYTPILAA